MSDPAEVPIEELETQICELAGHIDAATGRFLGMLGELDARQGWGYSGLASCAHWLSWRCGLSLGAAREKVRVARALRELPVISALARSGELSYAKVRALSRVATPDTETEMAELARFMTAAQCERLVRVYRRAVPPGDAAERARHNLDRRYVESYVDDDGCVVIRARLSPAQGAVVLAALEAAAEADLVRSYRSDVPAGTSDKQPTTTTDVSAGTSDKAQTTATGVPAGTSNEHATTSADIPAGTSDKAQPAATDVPAGTSGRPITANDVPAGTSGEAADTPPAPDVRPSAAQRRADALVELAEAWLARPSVEPGEATEAHHEVVIHVDAAVLANDSAGGRCHSESAGALIAEEVRRFACDGDIRVVAERSNGTPMDVGRRIRAIPARLRKALGLRDDHRCRFPGCSNTWVDAHHVQPWSHGGATELANMVLICRRHHSLVHEGGWRLSYDADTNTVTVTRPDNYVMALVPPAPELLSDIEEVNAMAGIHLDADTCASLGWGERMDYSMAVEGWLQINGYMAA